MGLGTRSHPVDKCLFVLAPSKNWMCNRLKWDLSKILSLFGISCFNLQGWWWYKMRRESCGGRWHYDSGSCFDSRKSRKWRMREKLRGRALVETWEGTGLACGTGQQERTASDVGEGWVSAARAAPGTCGQRGDSARVCQPGSQPQHHCPVPSTLRGKLFYW